jgi:hypothetical protein
MSQCTGAISGTPTSPCGYTNPGQCNADPCCAWQAPSGPCYVLGCSVQTNPDVCPGCVTCNGNWNMNDERGNTPWSITVTALLNMQNGGGLTIVSGRVVSCVDVNMVSASHVYISQGSLRIT